MEGELVPYWKDRFPLPDNDFEFLEPVLALRTTMLQTLVEICQNKDDKGKKTMDWTMKAFKDLLTHLEIQAKIARQANSPQVQ